jgi:hypothetical protein
MAFDISASGGWHMWSPDGLHLADHEHTMPRARGDSSRDGSARFNECHQCSERPTLAGSFRFSWKAPVYADGYIPGNICLTQCS